jgi:hypothetical protein
MISQRLKAREKVRARARNDGEGILPLFVWNEISKIVENNECPYCRII